MPQPTFPLVDSVAISRLVGRANFVLGQALAKAGAVEALRTHGASTSVTGIVVTETDRPVRAAIALETLGRSVLPGSTTCECEASGDCEHVAAVLLASNAASVRESATAADTAVGRTSVQSGSPVSSWQGALDSLTGAEHGGPDGRSGRTTAAGGHNRADDPPRAVPMALQFELRDEQRRTHDRWRGPTTTTAQPGSIPNGRRLGIRPVIRSASGSWARSTLTWGSMTHQVNRLSLDPVHHRWFAQLAALHRATREASSRPDLDWIYLDEFTSPLLWQLLAEANRLGIALVGARKGTVVTVADSAEISLSASRSESGDLELAPAILIGGESADPSAVGAVSDHGVYAYSFSLGTHIALAPTREPLGSRERTLLAGQATVQVPAADVPVFVAGYLPRLRRLMPVVSPDGSVDLPEIRPPELEVTAAFGELLSVTVLARWTDGRSPTAALEAYDDDRERDIAARLDAILDSTGAPFTVKRLLRATGVVLDGDAAADFAEHTLPALSGPDGIVVTVVGTIPDFTELTGVPSLTLRTVESEKRDWFDLGVMVSIDGRSVPFGPLFKALSQGRPKLRLVDNSYLSLKQPLFDRLRELIEESKDLAEWETGPRLNRYQAGLWAEFEDLADQTIEATRWREAVSGLNNVESIEPVAPPAGLSATLRPYQLDGLAWLAFLWKHRLGGVLADDMGLGKTIQTLALIAHTRENEPQGDRKPFLVVAPTSVASNWLVEAAKFTPGLVARGITATQAKSKVPIGATADGADIVVTSYALFRLDFEGYNAVEWGGLILDEAQFAKTHTSQVHRCARDLPVPFKLAVTGTPMENNLMELWAIFAIVAPGLFPSARRFREQYLRPAETSAGQRVITRLRRHIRPFIIRRTKELVAPELPEKQEQIVRVTLAPAHRRLYDTVLQRERQKLFGLIEDLDKNRFIVFRSLTLLRMLSLDASLIGPEHNDIPSRKLDALIEHLSDVIGEGHRALVFSQFTTFLGKAAQRLDTSGIAYSYLDGSSRRRNDIVSGFTGGQAPVFLISLKAGGVGLNLTEADYVFLLDPWWNPAAESQAIDRTHRIGQSKNVMVYRFVAENTIEEKVMELKDRKAELTASVLDDDAAFSAALTAEDLRGLFES